MDKSHVGAEDTSSLAAPSSGPNQPVPDAATLQKQSDDSTQSADKAESVGAAVPPEAMTTEPPSATPAVAATETREADRVASDDVATPAADTTTSLPSSQTAPLAAAEDGTASLVPQDAAPLLPRVTVAADESASQSQSASSTTDAARSAAAAVDDPTSNADDRPLAVLEVSSAGGQPVSPGAPAGASSSSSTAAAVKKYASLNVNKMFLGKVSPSPSHSAPAPSPSISRPAVASPSVLPNGESRQQALCMRPQGLS